MFVGIQKNQKTTAIKSLKLEKKSTSTVHVVSLKGTCEAFKSLFLGLRVTSTGAQLFQRSSLWTDIQYMSDQSMMDVRSTTGT